MKKLALCSLVVMAVVASTSIALATQKSDKDSSPAPVGTRGLLDCTNAIDAGCGFSYTGTNGTGVNNVEAYNCQPFTEDGPEIVFALNLGVASTVDIIMDTAGGDLDLFMLASCDENDCIYSSAGISHEEIHTLCLDPGTYYVVVDGYAGTVDNFTISINCTDCGGGGGGNETCDTAEPLGCGQISLATNTNGATNDYDPGAGNTCTGYSASGGDLVWSVCIPANGSVHLTFDELDYDSSIYLVTDCANPVGTCLDGDDCYPWPCTDFIDYVNGPTDVAAYLIVDGFAGATGNGRLSGTVDCCNPVATEKQTWGGVKAKY